MSQTIIVHVYTCQVTITDDRYSDGPRTTHCDRDVSLEPFTPGETVWADGHCRTTRTGGDQPSYRLEVEGETFRTTRDKLFVRFPIKGDRWEVADGQTLLIMASHKDRVRSLGIYDDVPPPAEVVAVPEPEAVPVPPKITVEWGPPPVGPPPKRTQLSMFDEEAA